MNDHGQASGPIKGDGAPHTMILGLCPLEHPDARLVIALGRAGAVGILDLGRDVGRARAALDFAQREATRGFGVRIPEGVSWDPADLPAGVHTVVVGAGRSFAAFRPRAVLVQVTSVDEAVAAENAGADGLIVKGAESGGRVGAETSFVLFQRVVAAVKAPIWVQGGVGLHTAAACVAGGAAGVVLDAQLALVRESTLPDAVKSALRAMDGSETVVLGGHRLFTRPDLPVARLKAAITEGIRGIDAAEILPRLGGADLQRCFLPAGQDAAFARPLSDRFRTAGGIVHAIRAAVDEHLQQAREARPLAAGAPLAAGHSVRYPVIQGPMTRVSDRAAFADAVSRAGGLPFLALSLLGGDEVRALLGETRALLGDRPFGVGLLGFAPEALRAEQLAVIAEEPPAVAILAGGRPAQAQRLEAQGTEVYLHVPSPGLLDLFLQEGARRFVFEGRECGGHVGPRTSFVLWEAQIERLLAFEAPGELAVLFAGGIHDARSAAMVAAMAAPLAARGARVGVVMGTAYLFTHEAVSSGAIQPGFQDAALACERTVLLETAPGHATRCVETDYVRAFADEKRRLTAGGKSAEETWAALEQLNLGRLRVAAKGLRREGSGLVPVDAGTQRREGMFMIGQIAALRGVVVGMEDLHRDVTEGATARIAATAPREVAAPKPAPVDVAIVGMSCIFPGATDLEEFWANVVGGRDLVTEVPKERWSTELYFDPTGTGGDQKTCSRWGAFLPPTAFDPLAHGIPPRSLGSIDPVQLLSLEVAGRALADAGYATRSFDRSRASVIFGAEGGTDLGSAYGFRALYPQYAGAIPKELDEHLPRLSEDSFPGVLANVIAGRIANRLDLRGVNYTVDAACASSLAALDLGVKELSLGTSDLVLCGGADLHNGIHDYLMFASVHALSPTGACRPFSASADGIVLGEGVACLVLKRLADAERDGDRVYAVIKSVAGSSDGRSLGLTAPRKEGQTLALERAYRAAGVSPADVGLVEAHGTGTVVGDRAELGALTEVFTRAGALPGATTLGSVKSQIGHTKCAAGLAGLIKAALSLHRRALPPTLHLSAINAAHDAAVSPFVFSNAARPWPAEGRRLAGVSAFGFGGTNFHAVLAAYEGADDPASGLGRWPAELFLIRAADRAGAVAQLDKLDALLATADPLRAPLRLADLARRVSTGSRTEAVQVAIVATSLDDLRAKLGKARTFTPDPRGVLTPRDATAGGPGKVAFLFPGQGSQRPGMLADLFVAFPRLQRLLTLDPGAAARMFPALAITDEERAAQVAALTDTRVAQPALGIAALAIGAILRALGIEADMAGGHSYGELCALQCAGAVGEGDLIRLSAARGAAILASSGGEAGTMAAVSAAPGEIAPLLEGLDRVVVANHNAPDQSVIAGPIAAVSEAVTRLSAAGFMTRAIPVACAFHSPLVAGASALFAAHLVGVSLAAPTLPVFSNVNAAPYPDDAEAVRRMLAEHVALPVRFVDQIEAMYAGGARTFVEVGAGSVLTGLVGKILAGRPHLAVACDLRGASTLEQLLRAVAELAVAGLPIDATALFAGRDGRAIDLDAAASLRVPASTWIVDGRAARPLDGEPPPGSLRPVTGPVVIPVSAPAGDREGAVLEYLRSTREIIEAQRQVMLGLLGSASGSVEGPATRRDAAPTSAPRTVPSARQTSSLAAPPTLPVARAPGLPSEAGQWQRELERSAGTSSAAAPAARGLQQALLSIVSDRTGYPVEMLDLDLNLEAELSIDSIKRIEILGALGNELGIKKGERRVLEQLATMKTLRAIITVLEQQLAAPSTPAPAAKTLPPDDAAVAPRSGVKLRAGAVETIPDTIAVPGGVRRYVLTVEDAPVAGASTSVAIAGRRFAITRDRSGVAEALVALLGSRGAAASLIEPGQRVADIDGLVHLASFDASAAAPDASLGAVKELFDRTREAVAAGATMILAATHLGAPFGPEAARPRPGTAGLLKSLARERPDLVVRSVELDPREAAVPLAEHLCAELAARDGRAEIAYVGGARKALAPIAAEHRRFDAVRADDRRVSLDAASVVLVTGGARGITASAAIALARRFRCRVELCGRSPLPTGDEDPALRGATDLPSLRRALLSRGEGLTPAVVEARCAEILGARAIRGTLAALAEAGSTARYHALDVRDQAAFGALIDELYAEHGRLDGVLHGAGVIEDRLLADKTRASFDRVVDTKVQSALTLALEVRPDIGFVAFFGSVSGAFGNRGQLDYAAANDALDKLASWLSTRVRGRVVSLDWGPWASGAGMVSPELEREYHRRGVGLIDPVDGARAFLDELVHGGSATQVILMNATPEAFTRPSTSLTIPAPEPELVAGEVRRG